MRHLNRFLVAVVALGLTGFLCGCSGDDAFGSIGGDMLGRVAGNMVGGQAEKKAQQEVAVPAAGQ